MARQSCIKFAARQIKSLELLLGFADRGNLAMASRIVILQNAVVSGRNYFAIFNDDRTEWAAVIAFDSDSCFFDGKLHEFLVVAHCFKSPNVASIISNSFGLSKSSI